MLIKTAGRIVLALLATLSVASLLTTHRHAALVDARVDQLERGQRILDQLNALGSSRQRLTSALRSYAATADSQFADLYRMESSLLAERTRALVASAAVLPAPARQAIERALERMRGLQAIEDASRAEIAAGGGVQASAQLHAQAYQQAELALDRMLEDARTQLEAGVTRESEALGREAGLVGWIALALQLAILLAVFLAIHGFYRSRLLNPLLQLTRRARDLLNGVPGVRFHEVRASAEVAELADLLDAYRHAADEVEQERWLKASVADVSERLQQADSLALFADTLLSRLAPPLGAPVMALHVRSSNADQFRCAGAYGVAAEHAERMRSEGAGALVQEAAHQGRRIEVSAPPPGYLRIESGLGAADPALLVLAPLAGSGEVLGVLEFAGFSPLELRQQLLLDELLPVVAARLEILLRSRRTLELLDATREQSAQLVEQGQLLAAERDRLARTEAWYRSIIHSAPDGILIADADGLIVLTNQRAEQLFGYDSGKLLGLTVEALVPRAQRAGHPALRRGFMQAHGARPMGLSSSSLAGQRKDGSEFPLEASLAGLPELDGHGICVCVVLRDITERHQAERSMREARGEAEAAARLKSDFLANMSHEIRTPMNAIIGMTHLMLKTELNLRQRDYLSKIHSSSQHLLGIINDILDFSKIEAGQLRIEHSPFDLDDVFDALSGLFAEKAQSKGLELIYDVPSEVPRALKGDSLRVGQVLINFVNNAIKFTDSGEVRVSVRVLDEDAEGLKLQFEVADTGIGLSKEQMNSLFQSFQQADTSTTRRYGGTGLGLAISRQLAALMGGETGVASELGAGSRFWFSARLQRAAERPYRFVPAQDLRGRRLLVVDDNEAACEVMSSLLTGMGFEVGSAGHGEAALQQVESAVQVGRPFELVFLDWRMPDLDGFDVAERIRALGLPPDLAPKLVMVTAYGREEVFQRASNEGFEQVLVKPLNASVLFNTVIRALGDRSEARALLAQPASDPASDLLAALQGARVLLVEDNLLNQEVARELLVDAGLRVDTADNGLRAIELLMDEPEAYSAVLMDMQMPILDGVEAARRLRADPRFDRLPIIAMTANVMAQDRQRCLDAGMDDFTPKPIDPPILMATLACWIREGRTTDSVEALASSTPMVQDLRFGLARVGGRPERMRHFLQRLRTAMPELLGRIASALEAGDRSEAALHAHSIKGMAGNLGAAALAKAAAVLETALRSGAGADAIELHQTGLTLAFARWQDEVAPILAEAPVDTAADDRHVAGELRELLAENDAEAVEWLLTHGERLHAHLGAAAAEISALVLAYDFPAALVRLDATLEQMGEAP
jgi:two-component system sensor histidine kinase/response regulator